MNINWICLWTEGYFQFIMLYESMIPPDTIQVTQKKIPNSSCGSFTSNLWVWYNTMGYFSQLFTVNIWNRKPLKSVDKLMPIRNDRQEGRIYNTNLSVLRYAPDNHLLSHYLFVTLVTQNNLLIGVVICYAPAINSLINIYVNKNIS